MDRSIYAPSMSLRSSISCATNRIRAELTMINSFKVDELKSNEDARKSFKSHILNVANETQNLINISEAIK